MAPRERIQTRTIGVDTYEIEVLPTGLGRPLLVRITRELAPILGAVAKGASESASAALGEALSHLGSLSEETIAECERVFGAHSCVVESRDKKPRVSAVFDDHFAGRYDALAKWIYACAEVNFGSFFAEGLRASGIGSGKEPMPPANAQAGS